MSDVVIRHRRLEPDSWQVLGLSGDPIAAPFPGGRIIVPLAAWKERRAELLARTEPLGIWLAPDDEPAGIAADVGRFAIIAVHFPKFGDGRGYSTGALLRSRYGYRSELRAIGDVGRDQIFYLARCGFDSFRLADHRDPQAALAAFHDFSLRYQGSVDDPVPLFRKRGAAAGSVQ